MESFSVRLKPALESDASASDAASGFSRTFGHGSASATSSPGNCRPDAATTMYCLPFTM